MLYQIHTLPFTFRTAWAVSMQPLAFKPSAHVPRPPVSGGSSKGGKCTEPRRNSQPLTGLANLGSPR